MLELRGYQQNIITDVENTFISSNKIPVMSMCPGAGKTVTSLEVIRRLLIRKPDAKVLILAHGTSVLRQQFYDAILDPKFGDHFKSLQDKAVLIDSRAKYAASKGKQVFVSIPQSMTGVKLHEGEFDLIVVDEAHHYYLSREGTGLREESEKVDSKSRSQVQRIINKVKPKHQLLLTGTPSKFIYENDVAAHLKQETKYLIHAVAMEEILDRMADLKVEVSTSTYNVLDDEYNESGEVLSKAVRREFDDKERTHTTTERFLEALIARISNKPFAEAASFNSSVMRKITSTLFPKEHKTMIMCKSIKQATHVEEKLKELGHTAISSHQDSDPDNENIKLFKESNNYTFLIVVQRGILGFDDPTLTAVVDMSGTKNLDRMYQAMARVVRKSPDNRTKLFLKVAANHAYPEADYTQHLVNAMLCLTLREYITAYNGKNTEIIAVPVYRKGAKEKAEAEGKTAEQQLMEMVPPECIDRKAVSDEEFQEYVEKYEQVKKQAEKKAAVSDEDYKDFEDKKNNKRKTLDSIVFPNPLKVLEFMQSVKHNSGAIFAICAKASLKDIKRGYRGVGLGFWSEEKITKEALKYKTRWEFGKKSPGAYYGARYRDIMDKVCSHMEYQYSNWTPDSIQTEALKYKTKSEFSKSGAYDAARRLGIFDEVCSHMKVSFNFWDKESIHKEALKYKTRKDFQKGSSSAEQKARKLGILDEVCSHMETQFKSKEERLEELCGFVKVNNRMPSKHSKNKTESTAGQWVTRNNKLPEIIELKKKYNTKGPIS